MYLLVFVPYEEVGSYVDFVRALCVCAVVVKMERLKLSNLRAPKKSCFFTVPLEGEKFCMDQLFDGYGGA